MLLFTNNAEGTLAAGITAGDTTIVLTAGHGARFPDASGAESYFYATMIDTSNNKEIVKVTNRATDTLTVVRGQDGTTPRSFLSGDRFTLRWNRAMIDASRQESTQRTSTSGTDTYAATLSPIPKAYNTGQVYCISFGAANTVAAPTLDLNGLGAKTIKTRSSGVLSPGQLNGIHLLLYNGTDFLVLNPRMAPETPGARGSSMRVDPSAATGIAFGADLGYISGLDCSINATDPTNDIDIAAGEAASNDAAFTSRVMMALAGAITKRLDATWAVGTNQGGLDGTESVAGVPDNDTWYYIWLIMRSDTGVVDVLFSESPTSPNMPASYDKKRLISVVRRATAANRRFSQDGSRILQSEVNVLSGGTATADTGVTLTSAIPTPVAKSFMCSGRSNVSTADSSQSINDVVIQVATGVDYMVLSRWDGVQENAGLPASGQSGQAEVPNTGVFNYRNAQSNTVSRSASIWVQGFTLAR